MNGAELKRFSEAVLALHECAAPADVGATLVRAMSVLTEADMHVVNWIGPNNFLNVAAASRPYPAAAKIDIFNALFHEHPLRWAVERAWTEGQQAGRWSDVVTLREFRQTALYQDFFRYMETRHQMAVTFPVCQQAVIGLSYTRSRCDFRDEDMQLLELFAPHVRQMVQTMMGRAEMEAALALSAIAIEHEALMLVDQDGNLRFASEAGRRVVREYFAASEGDPLPVALRQWVLRAPAAGGMMVLERPDRRLDCACGPPVPWTGASLEEIFSSGDRPLFVRCLRFTETKEADAVRMLQALGLTPREAEVLHWMTQGKRNSEIAVILGLSERTADKHREHVFAKLGVETRTAAVARAFEELGRNRMR